VSTIVWSLIYVIYETNKIIKIRCNLWLLPVAFIAKHQKQVGRLSKRVFVITGRDTVMTWTHLRLLPYLNLPLSSHHRAKGMYICLKCKMQSARIFVSRSGARGVSGGATAPPKICLVPTVAPPIFSTRRHATEVIVLKAE